eukprot:TRINITY_DN6218_c0_g1_i2.p2 TRINITY_DN6218_c0_g1~~TRINITY_DN6218_c0_g1_i2.p2  ORF type:complete len:103 (-),score=13.31 TRINITY_DN6218_c0_g1_i2:281-589(-)
MCIRDRYQRRVRGHSISAPCRRLIRTWPRSSTRSLCSQVPTVAHQASSSTGKGGVGKSTCATQLARCFVARGSKVGVLDVDICGPSVPLLLGLEDREVGKAR